MRQELGTRGGLDGALLSRSSLLSPVCAIVWNESKLAVSKGHGISLQHGHEKP